MEAQLGIAAAALLFLLTFLRPAYAVAMALCVPMIHPAIGEGGAFLGPVSPIVLFAGAALRAMFTPGHPEQGRLCFADMAMLAWLAYLPAAVLLNVNEQPDVVVNASMRLAIMAFSFYVSIRLLCFSMGANAFCRSFAMAMVVFGVFITVVALNRDENANAAVTRLTIGGTYIGLSIFITTALLCGVFMLFFVKDQMKRFERPLVLASVPLLFYGMLLCNTRGVVLALIATSFLLLWRAMFSSRLSAAVGRRAAVGMIVSAILAIGAAVAFPGTWERMGDKFNDLSGGVAERQAVGESEQTRLDLFAAAIDMFADYPIFGSGVGTFEVAMNAYPHNLVLQVMAEMGLVGLCLLVIVMGGSVLITLKYHSVNALFINALVVFQLLESMVSLSFWMQKNLFVFVAMAVAHHLYQLAPKKTAKGRSRRRRRRGRPETRLPSPPERQFPVAPMSRVELSSTE